MPCTCSVLCSYSYFGLMYHLDFNIPLQALGALEGHGCLSVGVYTSQKEPVDPYTTPISTCHCSHKDCMKMACLRPVQSRHNMSCITSISTSCCRHWERVKAMASSA